LFKPKLFLPAHHDAAPPAWVDLGLEPLFDKIRAEMPNTAFLAPLYRSPICVAGAGPEGQARVVQVPDGPDPAGDGWRWTGPMLVYKRTRTRRSRNGADDPFRTRGQKR
jgi:hypothetical protein